MRILIVIFAFLLFVAACVPITPEPDATEPASPIVESVDCASDDYREILPGQSAKDPISESLPGYIDIVGVAASLEGETLTATFYLREIPEMITVNREGVEPTTIEHMWWVDISVAGAPKIDDGDSVSHALGTFSPATTSSSVRSVQFGLRPYFETQVYRYQPHFETQVHGHEDTDGDRKVVYMVPENRTATLEVSREDNSLTLTGAVPGITPETPLLLSTFDILEGQDGVSCQPLDR